MTVLTYPEGKPVNWVAIARDPNRVTKMVQWHKRSLSGKLVRGSLFFIAALDEMNTKALAKFDTGVDIIQPAYNTGVSASEGTHDFDNCIDWRIAGVSDLVAQRFARFECGMADWARTRAQGFSPHNHGFFLPPGGKIFPFKVGKYVDGGRSLGLSGYSSQLDDYWRDALGLKNNHHSGSDRTAFPTYKQKMDGIFDLDRYIQRQLEKEMEFKDWSKESKDECADLVAKKVMEKLDETKLIDRKDDNDVVVGRDTVPSAIQRLLNSRGRH